MMMMDMPKEQVKKILYSIINNQLSSFFLLYEVLFILQEI
jgi:hypothetical protein